MGGRQSRITNTSISPSLSPSLSPSSSPIPLTIQEYPKVDYDSILNDAIIRSGQHNLKSIKCYRNFLDWLNKTNKLSNDDFSIKFRTKLIELQENNVSLLYNDITTGHSIVTFFLASPGLVTFPKLNTILTLIDKDIPLHYSQSPYNDNLLSDYERCKTQQATFPNHSITPQFFPLQTSPLHIAIQNKYSDDIIQLLIDHGARLISYDSTLLKTPLILYLETNNKPSLDIISSMLRAVQYEIAKRKNNNNTTTSNTTAATTDVHNNTSSHPSPRRAGFETKLNSQSILEYINWQSLHNSSALSIAMSKYGINNNGDTDNIVEKLTHYLPGAFVDAIPHDILLLNFSPMAFSTAYCHKSSVRNSGFYNALGILASCEDNENENSNNNENNKNNKNDKNNNNNISNISPKQASRDAGIRYFLTRGMSRLRPLLPKFNNRYRFLILYYAQLSLPMLFPSYPTLLSTLFHHYNPLINSFFRLGRLYMSDFTLHRQISLESHQFTEENTNVSLIPRTEKVLGNKQTHVENVYSIMNNTHKYTSNTSITSKHKHVPLYLSQPTLINSSTLHNMLFTELNYFTQRLQHLYTLVQNLPTGIQEYIFKHIHDTMQPNPIQKNQDEKSPNQHRGSYNSFFQMTNYFDIRNPLVLRNNLLINNPSKKLKDQNVLPYMHSQYCPAVLLLNDCDTTTTTTTATTDLNQPSFSYHNQLAPIYPFSIYHASLHHLYHLLSNHDPEWWEPLQHLQTFFSPSYLLPQYTKSLTNWINKQSYHQIIHPLDDQGVLVGVSSANVNITPPSNNNNDNNKNKNDGLFNPYTFASQSLVEQMISNQPVQGPLYQFTLHCVDKYAVNFDLFRSEAILGLHTDDDLLTKANSNDDINNDNNNSNHNGSTNDTDQNYNKKNDGGDKVGSLLHNPYDILTENIIYCYYRIWYGWCRYFTRYPYLADGTNYHINNSHIKTQLFDQENPLSLDQFLEQNYPVYAKTNGFDSNFGGDNIQNQHGFLPNNDCIGNHNNNNNNNNNDNDDNNNNNNNNNHKSDTNNNNYSSAHQGYIKVTSSCEQEFIPELHEQFYTTIYSPSPSTALSLSITPVHQPYYYNGTTIPRITIEMLDAISIQTSGVIFKQPTESILPTTSDQFYAYLDILLEQCLSPYHPTDFTLSDNNPSSFNTQDINSDHDDIVPTSNNTNATINDTTNITAINSSSNNNNNNSNSPKSCLNPLLVPQPGETLNFSNTLVPGLLWWVLLYSGTEVNYDDLMSFIPKVRCDILNNIKQSTLMYAMVRQWPERILILLARRMININLRDVYGRTALHYYFMCGLHQYCTELLSFLVIDCGAVLNIIDAFGHSPLSYAIYTNCKDDILCLLIDWTLTRFPSQNKVYYHYFEPQLEVLMNHTDGGIINDDDCDVNNTKNNNVIPTNSSKSPLSLYTQPHFDPYPYVYPNGAIIPENNTQINSSRTIPTNPDLAQDLQLNKPPPSATCTTTPYTDPTMLATPLQKLIDQSKLLKTIENWYDGNDIGKIKEVDIISNFKPMISREFSHKEVRITPPLQRGVSINMIENALGTYSHQQQIAILTSTMLDGIDTTSEINCNNDHNDVELSNNSNSNNNNNNNDNGNNNKEKVDGVQGKISNMNQPTLNYPFAVNFLYNQCYSNDYAIPFEISSENQLFFVSQSLLLEGGHYSCRPQTIRPILSDCIPDDISTDLGYFGDMNNVVRIQQDYYEPSSEQEHNDDTTTATAIATTTTTTTNTTTTNKQPNLVQATQKKLDDQKQALAAWTAFNKKSTRLTTLLGIMVRFHTSYHVIEHLMARIGYGLMVSSLPFDTLKQMVTTAQDLLQTPPSSISSTGPIKLSKSLENTLYDKICGIFMGFDYGSENGEGNSDDNININQSNGLIPKKMNEYLSNLISGIHLDEVNSEVNTFSISYHGKGAMDLKAGQIRDTDAHPDEKVASELDIDDKKKKEGIDQPNITDIETMSGKIIYPGTKLAVDALGKKYNDIQAPKWRKKSIYTHKGIAFHSFLDEIGWAPTSSGMKTARTTALKYLHLFLTAFIRDNRQKLLLNAYITTVLKTLPGWINLVERIGK